MNAPLVFPVSVDYSVRQAGTTTYDYSRHQSQLPSCLAFELIVSATSIDRVFPDSTMETLYTDFRDPIPSLARYQVCCNEQTSLNNVTLPWPSLFTTNLADFGVSSAECDDIILGIRNLSGRILGRHQHCNSGPVRIPNILVNITVITEYLEHDYLFLNGFECDYNHGNDNNELLDASFLAYEVTTVPASDASVQALERVMVDNSMNGDRSVGSSGTDQCAICLDGFTRKGKSEADGDGVLIRMPCKHLFHQDCITTWLKTSNACPLCRSELAPASVS